MDNCQEKTTRRLGCVVFLFFQKNTKIEFAKNFFCHIKYSLFYILRIMRYNLKGNSNRFAGRNMKKVYIYTDGACSGNPGPGGWGAILLYNGIEKRISGFELETTNNRMELLSAIEALSKLKEPCEVHLYSDSAYLVNAFNQNWLTSWVNNNWKIKSKEIKNKDLWTELIRLSNTHDITFIKVKGHSDNEYNNLCDKMAREQIENNKLK